MKTTAQFIMVKGAGHIAPSSIVIGSSIANLPESGKCDYCHRFRDGKTVHTVNGKRFICFQHRKIAYTL